MTFLSRALCVIGITSFCFYFYIDQQNQLTLLRLEIPNLAQQVKSVQEENLRLKYEIDSFESPLHLMELASKPEFSHLKHPYLKDIIQLPAPNE